jgi:ABC-type sugar transport system permease subunit
MSKRKGISIETRDALTAYAFLSPWLIGLIAFVIYPVVYSLYMAFQDVRITGTGIVMTPNGINNFKQAFLMDNQFTVLLTAYIRETVMIVPIIVLFAMFVAIMLNFKFPGKGFFRALFFLPVIFATGQVLNEIFNQGAGGLSILDQYNIKPLIQSNIPATFANPLIAVLDKFVLILWYSGVQVLIFLAGLQTIGKPVYEAASIDGASPWDTFWKITLPGITPFILLNAVYTIVDLSTYPFNQMLNLIVNHMKYTGYGYASAIGWIYFSIVLIMIGLIFLISRRFVHYAGER